MGLRHTQIFNSPVEIGLRALCVLVHTYPRRHDLQMLVLLDYLLVHSADVEGGPPSLHPPLPQRGKVSDSVLESGLILFASRGLVAGRTTKQCVQYAATDHAAAYLDALDASHTHDLRERAEWINELFASRSARDIRETVQICVC